MKELQRRQKMKKILYSIPSLMVIFLLTFLFAKGAFKVMDKKLESTRRLEELEAQVISLTLREDELEEGISRLKTYDGVEEEIRERFSVIQEGEQVAVIVDDPGSTNSTDNSSLPWYKKLWFGIIGNK